jgi:signal transduction histidine kinase
MALAASAPAQSAEARLALARVLVKLGRTDEAFALYRALLSAPPDARDEFGIGYRFYAVERLLSAGKETDRALSFVRREVEGDGWITLPELHMVRPFLDVRPDSKLQRRMSVMHRIEVLASDYTRVRTRVEAAAMPSESGWIPYEPSPDGLGLWLITTIPAQPPFPGLLVAVSAAKVTPPGVRLVAAAAPGDDLGEGFPGLRAQAPDHGGIDTQRNPFPMAVWVSGLALVLGVGFFGGYLLLRDVHRDMRATEVRAQFVASVSHELKTPLTSIRMFAETLALGRSRDERTRTEYLETIVNESERLTRLVDNVLDFSNIEQGKKIYRLRPVHLDEVAAAALRALEIPLSQQGFRLHFKAEEDLPELQADADAIQQAILNLLTNAMKYSGESRDIAMSLGLAPGEKNRVFQKFYRAPSHEKHLIAGTGLGLTLVAHIVAAHGGHVEVESTPGVGSRFSIFLPIGAQA